jgi:hypothetical protein
MKSSAIQIERMLEELEARLVPPPLPLPSRLPHVVYHEGEDLDAAMEKALAEHIAAHPEDAGFTVASITAALEAAGRRWMVHKIVHTRQFVPLKDEDAVRRLKDEDTVRDIEDAAVPEPEMSDLSADPGIGVSAIPASEAEIDGHDAAPDLNVLSTPDKPWRPVHQRPARDMRRPTWKKWER